MKNKAWSSANLEFVQWSNYLLVLNILRNQGPISRAEISKTTGLSPTTVSYAVNSLLENQLAKEIGVGVSSGGKRPILLEFNPKGSYILTLVLNEFKLLWAVSDLQGELELLEEIPLQGRKGEEALDFLVRTIERALAQAAAANIHPASIGIGISGIVNFKKGEVLYSAGLQWNNLELRELLEKKFDQEIFVVNDMNAAAYAEKVFQPDLKVANLLYIMVGQKIGAGMIIDHRIFEGYNGSAVEFGHTSVNLHGPRCNCGNYGCLTEYVSEDALLRRIAAAIRQGAPTALEGEALTVPAVARALRNGDPLAVQTVRESVFALSVGITNLVNLFNPELIVIAGDGMVQCDEYFQELKTNIFNMALKTAARDLAISRHRVPRAFLKGVAALAIEAYFEMPRVMTA